MRRKKKRLYRYREDTLTLTKLIDLIDLGGVIDLNRYSNGETWFRSLSKVLPAAGAPQTRRSVGAEQLTP